jgi:hypothetical protein
VKGKRDSHLDFAWDGTKLRAWLDGETHKLEPAEPPATERPAEVSGLAVTRGFKGSLEDVRLYGRLISEEEIRQLYNVEPARTILALDPEKRSKEQKQRLREYYLAFQAPEFERGLYTELKDVQERLRELDKKIPTVMVMDSAEKPRETHVLARGDYRNRGEQVQPGTPAVLPPLPAGAPRNRLGLAQWLVDPKHPLTARVAVNRFWALYFGAGLVKTVEDFGSQGELPSHPQLLDWLATEFIRTGWDVKALQRLIVTSATYRQSSQSTPELTEKDPDNRLLARGPRFRLPAEFIRDSALAASGLLQEHVGGPSVYPYSPDNLWEDIAYGDRFSAQVYPEVKPSGLYRRSLYTFWKRTAPPATLSTFDAPDREKCVARRPLTNTPLQALTLLNDPTFIEASRFLAERMIGKGGHSDAERIRYGFRLVTGRTPEAREVAVLARLLRAERGDYAKEKQSAAQLISVGMMPADRHIAPQELAAFTAVASTILNLDEAITKE